MSSAAEAAEPALLRARAPMTSEDACQAMFLSAASMLHPRASYLVVERVGRSLVVLTQLRLLRLRSTFESHVGQQSVAFVKSERPIEEVAERGEHAL